MLLEKRAAQEAKVGVYESARARGLAALNVLIKDNAAKIAENETKLKGWRDEVDSSARAIKELTQQLDPKGFVEYGPSTDAFDAKVKELARMASARAAVSQGLRDRELALIQDQAERELAIVAEKHRREIALFDAAAAKGEASRGDRDRMLALQASTEAQLRQTQALAAAGRVLAENASKASALAAIESDWAREAAARSLIIEGFVDREIALIRDRDAAAVASMEERFARERALLDKAAADGIASEEDRTRLTKIQDGERAAAAEESGKRREEAAAKEASAYAASAEAALGAAATLAEALGASAEVIAGINIAKEVAGAASEVAASAASAAVYDVPGAIAHGVAAAAHVAAAVKWGSDALGGGGGGGGAASAPSGGKKAAPATNKETVSSGDRERNRPSAEPPLNLYFQGQPLETRTDIQDAVIIARREGYKRRGGARDGNWRGRY